MNYKIQINKSKKATMNTARVNKKQRKQKMLEIKRNSQHIINNLHHKNQIPNQVLLNTM